MEEAATFFAGHVVLAAESGCVGLETLWNLCDSWLEHLEHRLFPRGYFFTAAFIQYAEQTGPIAKRIVKVVDQWFDALKNAIEQCPGAAGA